MNLLAEIELAILAWTVLYTAISHSLEKHLFDVLLKSCFLLLYCRWFAATKMAPSNARRVFPCFDEPELKASFEISVARTSRMTALSNMPVKSIEEM